MSRDILEWARDLAQIRELISADIRSDERGLQMPAIAHTCVGVVTPLRRLVPETVA